MAAYCMSVYVLPHSDAESHVPALVFSGDRDGCIASEVYSGIEGAFTSPVRFEIVRGAGHFLPLEATDRVDDLAVPFAREVIAPGSALRAAPRKTGGPP